MHAAGLAIIMFFALAASGCSGGEAPVSGEAKEWSFTDTDGMQHSLNSSKGEPSLLFFMATWCSKCQSTAPRLTTIQDEFESRGIHMYTLSHDPTEDAADLNGWKTKYGHDWPHGVDQGSTIAKTFKITQQSSLVILNTDGEESKKWIYAVPSLDDLRNAINAGYA